MIKLDKKHKEETHQMAANQLILILMDNKLIKKVAIHQQMDRMKEEMEEMKARMNL